MTTFIVPLRFVRLFPFCTCAQTAINRCNSQLHKWVTTCIAVWILDDTFFIKSISSLQSDGFMCPCTCWMPPLCLGWQTYCMCVCLHRPSAVREVSQSQRRWLVGESSHRISTSLTQCPSFLFSSQSTSPHLTLAAYWVWQRGHTHTHTHMRSPFSSLFLHSHPSLLLSAHRYNPHGASPPPINVKECDLRTGECKYCCQYRLATHHPSKGEQGFGRSDNCHKNMFNFNECWKETPFRNEYTRRPD